MASVEISMMVFFMHIINILVNMMIASTNLIENWQIKCTLFMCLLLHHLLWQRYTVNVIVMWSLIMKNLSSILWAAPPLLLKALDQRRAFYEHFFGHVLVCCWPPASDCSKHTWAQSIDPCRGEKVHTWHNLAVSISSSGISNQGVEAPIKQMKDGNHPIP